MANILSIRACRFQALHDLLTGAVTLPLNASVAGRDALDDTRPAAHLAAAGFTTLFNQVVPSDRASEGYAR
ncbi:hypothetical protein J7443_09780 [Tropicibacter sp. R15_0]|uniref:hypothetical protein n=1 Tax=Tropicibacter sp. R15_0 TaxID=2821101 RepID=UPI001ADAB174|nr:hypothetical protein [Tropicibacter sp. R15_0]MBO9465516.1 hypothetical protein [Tropicibacter sp. R15_0]